MNDFKQKVAIFGTGDHARVVVDTIEKIEPFQIIGFFDNQKSAGELIAGYPVLGKDEELVKFIDDIDCGLLAIGENLIRYRVSQFIEQLVPNFQFFTVIDPFTSISKNSEIDSGVMVMAGAVINVNTKIGKHAIINTQASIDHDNKIGNFTFIAPGVTTGGTVIVEDFAFIGIGATIVPGVTIGRNSVIGAGATVLEDIPENVLAVGTPAKIIKNV